MNKECKNFCLILYCIDMTTVRWNDRDSKIIIMKGLEPEWPNPKLNVELESSKKLKYGLKTIHYTLPSCQKLQKCEFSLAHEIHLVNMFQD